MDTCRQAVSGIDYVLHQAALGSVLRSINDPITTNDINITGFLNMLTAARDAKVKRFVYAAVIPKFVIQLMNHEAPTINGDGEYSRDFTYVENVVQANMLAVETNNNETINQVYNVAYGDRTTLNQLAQYLKECLSAYDSAIADIDFIHGENRAGDIPHSLASVEKAEKLLGYKPLFNLRDGLKITVDWY